MISNIIYGIDFLTNQLMAWAIKCPKVVQKMCQFPQTQDVIFRITTLFTCNI